MQFDAIEQQSPQVQCIGVCPIVIYSKLVFQRKGVQRRQTGSNIRWFGKQNIVTVGWLESTIGSKERLQVVQELLHGAVSYRSCHICNGVSKHRSSAVLKGELVDSVLKTKDTVNTLFQGVPSPYKAWKKVAKTEDGLSRKKKGSRFRSAERKVIPYHQSHSLQ